MKNKLRIRFISNMRHKKTEDPVPPYVHPGSLSCRRAANEPSIISEAIRRCSIKNLEKGDEDNG